MASKLTVFAALFVCFLVVADASLRLTTTVVEDQENPQQRRQSQQCQQQVQRQRIRNCQDYIVQQQRESSGRWDDDNDLEFEDEMNPQIRGQGQEYLDQCCQELEQIDRQCRCQALQEIARQAQQEQQQQGGRWRGQQQEGRYRGGQQQRIQQQVRQLPQICRVQVPQQCQQGY
ncbi:hypothetical protein LIER_42207 [Lithospermum erythrorhizon]|uniref:Bifunctional inhibitor/plant lipid transfer protein/seed storage helical domain-containing protein n=1 Tax=Lithospermum erythrorhizon TaxID=34254 RepID=A0AAV3PPC5_LITER